MSEKTVDEKYKKIKDLAKEVMKLSRDTVLINLRFLDSAISRLSYLQIDKVSGIFTQGSHVIYNPIYIIECFEKESELPVRDFLHSLFHCIFRHMYVDIKNINIEYWDLACDIAVESVISELGLKSASSSRERKQISYIIDLKVKIKHLTAERIYNFLVNSDIPRTKLMKIAEIFRGDYHDLWYMTKTEISAVLGIAEKELESLEEEQKLRNKRIEDWKKISKSMELELEAFLKKRGKEAGSLTQNLKELNRERYDYTSFLKKFAVLGEAVKINDDEFDYIYYTYGIKLYEKMPLVEPLEYKEVKKIRDFVIAIDTSGSTSGELVQGFIQKTYNILKSAESFFTKINVHIVQCDCKIQEIIKITSLEEFDKYLKTMKILGQGGTDFRPVFKYVNELLDKGEFTNLKGIIYLTDGDGEYPEKKPQYESAFVFIDDDYNSYNVPSWAMKLVLKKDEI